MSVIEIEFVRQTHHNGTLYAPGCLLGGSSEELDPLIEQGLARFSGPNPGDTPTTVEIAGLEEPVGETSPKATPKAAPRVAARSASRAAAKEVPGE